LQRQRLVVEELVSLTKESCFVPTTLEGVRVIAELRRCLCQEPASHRAVRHERCAVLTQNRKQLVFGQTSYRVITTLKDSWRYKVVVLANLHDFLDLFGGVVGEPKMLEDTLFINGIKSR
jgi:hypothetical protein